MPHKRLTTAQKDKENNMEKKTATSTEFGEHSSKEGSEELQKIFKRRPWQIQCPRKAKIIFLGYDANWVKNIEENQPFFKETIDYLTNGVEYSKNNWEKDNAHTPMLKEFYNEDGKRYHRKLKRLFQELNFSPNEVKDICLLELLNVCTFGMRKQNLREYNRLLRRDENKEHLKLIQELLEQEKENFICIAKGVRTTIIDELGFNIREKNVKIHTHLSWISNNDFDSLKDELLKFLRKT